jgi:hypothetical protein
MRTLLAITLGLALIAPAYADYDPELEAQERAEAEAQRRERQAYEQEMQKRHADAERQAQQALMQDKRRRLGAAAQGKSDAEVSRLYDEKVAADTAKARAEAAEARRMMQAPEAQAGIKAVTGHTMAEMQNMSEEELEAMAKKMEEQYGEH